MQRNHDEREVRGTIIIFKQNDISIILLKKGVSF